MLTLEPNKSFTHFKEKFYATFTDLEILDAYDFNALKIILDGLKVNYVEKFNRKTPLFFPFPLNFILYLIKYLKYAICFRKKDCTILNTNAKFLFIDFGKYIERNDKYFSFYYNQILNMIDSNHYQYFCFNDKVKTKYSENLNNFSYLKFNYNYIRYLSLRKKIRKIYRKVKKIPWLSKRDLLNIQIAFQNFYENVIYYDNILKQFPALKKLLINQHYHNESLIYAAHKKNIYVIELQHGLISEKDIFYVFPSNLKKIRDKALFPNEIWVYGNFWKSELLKGYEFDSNKIYVIGDFRYLMNYENYCNSDLNEIYHFINGYRCILITTQTFMHEEYMEYIIFLSDYIKSNKLRWRVIVKIHPNEKIEHYERIRNLHSVYLTDKAYLNYLFKICDIHVSIFSTTLFDALNFPHIKNFSLRSETYYDYHKQIVDKRIAYSLKRDEFPANKNNFGYELCDPKEIYDLLNTKLITARLYEED